MKKILIFLLLTGMNLLAQDADLFKAGFEWLPSGLHFIPIKANDREAHFGLQYYFANRNLKVDVGNNSDLIAFHFPSVKSKLTMGIEFFAFAYSTSYKGNRLQIDALDGFFGGNVTFSKQIPDSGRLFSRLRIIHNSAHFVDGHYDVSEKAWLNNQMPVPYTRDFGELLLAYEHRCRDYSVKYFGGMTYSTLVRPGILEKYSYSAGLEAASFNFLGKAAGKSQNLFISWYMNITGVPVYYVCNNLMIGYKSGDWYKKGVCFYLDYYKGLNVFSEYYNKIVDRVGLGFMVEWQ